jgi:ribosome-binding protein aMBF1 (putative translation factor)
MAHQAQRTIIQKILLTEWDPIGVSDIPEAQDEFNTYADTVSGMLTNRAASVDDIAQYLFKVATEQMGLSYSELAQRCEKAATAVAALQSDR